MTQATSPQKEKPNTSEIQTMNGQTIIELVINQEEEFRESPI